MKVFWSWQSDTPGKTGRHFVRHALDQAIAELKLDQEVDEPTREALHADQDRQGVPGSPDLAQTILRKISEAAVVLADVTAVATTSGGKKLINSNVAIELGYSLAVPGDRALQMVLNSHYGNIEELPFDLRHKAGPIVFRLPPDAEKREIEREGRLLASELKSRLRWYATSAPVTAAVPSFDPMPIGDNVAIFFRSGDVLARVGEPGIDEIHFRYSAEITFFLRLYPSARLSAAFRLAHLRRSAGTLPPLSGDRSGMVAVNEYGVIVFVPKQKGDLVAATQIFESGELWGFTKEFILKKDGGPVIVTPGVEESFYRVLRHYIEFASATLELPMPYHLQMGIVGLSGTRLAIPRELGAPWGPIRARQVVQEHDIFDQSERHIDEALLAFFEALFDLTGFERPSGLNNFPPGPPRP